MRRPTHCLPSSPKSSIPSLCTHTLNFHSFPLWKCSLFWVLLHTLMWRGQAEAPLLVLGERRTPEYSVSGTSGRTPLSRAYLAGGWYWHRQPSYRGPFISVWTCGLGPNPGRSRRARRQLRGWGVVAQRRNPALLLSSGAPPSIPAFPPLFSLCASLPHLLLTCCQSLSLYLRPTHHSFWFTKM